MSLGQAFIDVKANTTGFAPDLNRQIKASLKNVIAKVKVQADTRGLATQIQRDIRAINKPVKIKFEASGLATLRAQIQRELRSANPIELKFDATGMAALRAQIQREVRALPPIQIRLEPTNAATLRNSIRAALASLPPIPIKLTVTPAEIARLRILIQRGLAAMPPIVVRVVPKVVIAGGSNPFNDIVKKGGGAASQLDKLFASMAQRIRGNILQIPGAIVVAFAAVGAAVLAADAAIATFGIKSAVEVQQLQVAIQALEAGKILDPLAAEFQKGVSGADAFTKGASLAADQIERIQKFSIATAFNFKDAATGSLSLQTLGLNAKEALSVVRDLGNALALTAGGATGDRLQKALLPLLQAASTGKLLGQDLNQFAQILPGVFSRGKFLKQLQSDLGFAAAGTKELTEEFKDFVEKGLPAGPALDAVLKQLRAVPGITVDGVDALERAAKLTLPGAFGAAVETIRARAAKIFKDINQDLTDAIAGLGEVFGDALTKVSPKIEKLVKGLVSALPEIVSTFVETMNKVNTFLLGFFDRFGPLLLGIVAGIGNAFVGLGNIIDGIAGAFNRFKAFLAQDKANVPFLASTKAILNNLMETLRQVGPIFGNVFAGIKDAMVTLAPVIVPIVVVLTSVLEVLAKILASDFGQLIFGIGAIGVALFGFNALLATTAVSLTIAATATSLLTARFVIGALAAGNFAGALAALRGSALAMSAAAAIAGASTLGFAGIVVAAGAAAFLAGKFIGEKLAGAFGAGGAAARSATVDIQGTTIVVEDLIGAVRTLQADGNISIVVRDNFGQVVARLSGLNKSLASFRNANADLLGFSLDDLQKAQLRSQQEDAEGKIIGPILPGTTRKDFKEKIERPNFTDLLGGGSPQADDGKADSKAKAAADKIKARLEKFRDTIREILESLNRDFRDGLVAGDAKNVRKTLGDLAEKIADAFDEAGKKQPSALLKRIALDSKALQVLANERIKIVKQLEAATARAKEAVDGVRAFASIANLDFKDAAAAVTKLNIETLDIAGSFVVVSRTLESSAAAAAEAVKRTGKDFANGLKSRLAQIKAFQADIDTLIKRGLNRTTIDQLISEGVENGAATADTLANASQSTIDSIDKTQQAIDKAAKRLGNTAAENLFRSGGQIVDGLIAGLKDRKGEIVKEMTEIANALIKEIRKTLKIASPSKVFRKLFNNVGDGAVLGLSDSTAGIVKQAQAMSRAATPNLSPVGLPALRAASDAQGVRQLQVALQGQANGGMDTTAIVSAIQGARATKEIHAPITQNFAAPTSAVAAQTFMTVGRR